MNRIANAEPLAPVPGLAPDIVEWLREALQQHADSPVLSIELDGTEQTVVNRVHKVRVRRSNDAFAIYVKEPLHEHAAKALREEHERTLTFREAYRARSDAAVRVAGFRDGKVPILALMEVAGLTFLEVLDRCARWGARKDPVRLTGAARSVGLWLADLESATHSTHDAKAIWKALVDEVHHARYVISFLTSSERVLSTADAMVAAIEDFSVDYPEIPSYLCHGDLHPGNLILDEDSDGSTKVVALDLRLSQRRFAGYDWLYLTDHLRHGYGARRYNPARMRQVISGFLDGYGKSSDSGRGPGEKALRTFIMLRQMQYLCTQAQNATGLRGWAARIELITRRFRQLPS